jgi:hypothetical protein
MVKRLKQSVGGEKRELENEVNKVAAVNGTHSGCGVEMVYGRLDGWTSGLKKAIAIIKFLLFKEDNPKHFVWKDFEPLHLALILPLLIVPSIGFIVLGYLSFKVIGFVASYIIATLLPLEVFHWIFDR